MRRTKLKAPKEAELDITAFMNLMIVLVPVLLLGMVFSQITVLELKLPDAAAGGENNEKKQNIELVIRDSGMVVNYPQGILLKRIPNTEQDEYDFAFLTLVLQEVKRQLAEKSIEKKNITILSEPTINYQTIVTAMDTVRSYKSVVAASVVDAELFPEISFGDAPAAKATPGGAG